MTLESLIHSDLAQEFERQVRAKRKQPAKVLAKLMREYLEIQEDIKLMDEMRRDVKKSGYQGADPVKLVREYRSETRKQRAAS